jgi:hypothetical protein
VSSSDDGEASQSIQRPMSFTTHSSETKIQHTNQATLKLMRSMLRIVAVAPLKAGVIYATLLNCNIRLNNAPSFLSISLSEIVRRKHNSKKFISQH